MATNKQRIQAYVDQQLFELFEIERSAWGISQSQALERILAERYDTKVESPSVDHSALSDRLTRLEAEIRELVEINYKRFGMISNRINGLEGAVSQLFSKIPEKVSNSDGELESELLEDSNLDSELPSESLEDSNLDSSNSRGKLENESLDNSNSNSELEGESLDDSNSEGELEGESLGDNDSNSKSELKSESLDNSNSKSELESESLDDSNSGGELKGESLDDSNSEGELKGESLDDKYIVCKYNVDRANDPVYWHSHRQGFISTLEQAKTYKSEGTAYRQVQRLQDDEKYKPQPDEKINYKDYRGLEAMRAKLLADNG